MCGIVGIAGVMPVNQSIYDALTVLQHRGQDAAGIITIDANNCFRLRKANGLVSHSRELGFRQAVFEVGLSPLQEPGSQGMETVEFLFGPNPGEPSKPLRLIASSGELARIMLAIKSALAHKDSTPLLVFDEIDANVGGEVARAVGFKMQQLGNRHQVISITHFPQVAALASHHYLVQKASAGNRTISCLREVSHEDRIDELVRMLGGGGDHARTLAQALLQPS